MVLRHIAETANLLLLDSLVAAEPITLTEHKSRQNVSASLSQTFQTCSSAEEACTAEHPRDTMTAHFCEQSKAPHRPRAVTFQTAWIWIGLKMLPARSHRHPNISVQFSVTEEEPLTFPLASVG